MKKTPASFGIDPVLGFLSEDAIDLPLPAEFSDWQELGRTLPKLLMSDQLQSAVEKLPVVDVAKLSSEAALNRFMVIISFVGHGYVWGGQHVPTILPRSLAVPWYAAAQRCGRPPVLSYASYMLHNWRRIDPSRAIELGNVALLQNFLGGADEEWFILVHCDIEAKAAPALWGIWNAQEESAAQNGDGVLLALNQTATALESMYQSLLRMTERCDPYIYYHRVRPYIHGWKNHPALPQGLVYDGVDAYQGQPQQFRGETGAQSSIIPALDAALGIGHKDDVLKPYLEEMKDYMPPLHRAFIAEVASRTSIRGFVAAAQRGDLKDSYNRCVHWIELFRSKHLEYAANYIFKQGQKAAENPHAVGTGGTPFMPYLAKHRDETADHLLR